jgi:lipoyl(octanoyl) transferase
MRQWRLIYDIPTLGAANMAADEAVLRTVSAGEAMPTLRLYGWSPPCLSLGYAQKTGDVDFDRIARAGWDVVRRPTGGRAILHTDELTYSVSLPADDPIAAGGIIESYRRISGALLAGLERLGAEVAADKRAERSSVTGAVCFEVPSHYEITVSGRKLVGSAQLRRREGVLQHGSLPLFGDLGRICEALAYPDEDSREAAKAQVRARAITLEEALGGAAVTWQQAAEAIGKGFAQTFGIAFDVARELTTREQETARELAETVYSSIERRR